MKRLLISAVIWIGMAQAGLALTVEERLLSELQDQGYTIVEKGFTFLGRLRIVAESDLIHREIVVNPGTGEILRDYAVYLSDMPRMPPPTTTARTSSHGNRTVAAVRAAEPAPTGTAGVAASSLAPGMSTLDESDLSVDNTRAAAQPLLDSAILPMSSGTP